MYTEQLTTAHLFSTISFHFHNNPTKWVLWYHKDRSPFWDSCPFPKKFWASKLSSHPTEWNPNSVGCRSRFHRNSPPKVRRQSNTSQTQTLLRVQAGAMCNDAGKTDESWGCHGLTGMHGQPHPHVRPKPLTLPSYCLPQISHALSCVWKAKQTPLTPRQPGKLILQQGAQKQRPLCCPSQVLTASFQSA